MSIIELKSAETRDEMPADAEEVFNIIGYKIPSEGKSALSLIVKPELLKGDDKATEQAKILTKLVVGTLQRLFNSDDDPEPLEEAEQDEKEANNKHGHLFCRVECRLDTDIGGIGIGIKIHKQFIDNYDGHEAHKEGMKKVASKVFIALRDAGLTMGDYFSD